VQEGCAVSQIEWQKEIFAYCEHLEDEAYEALNGDKPITDHERGYYSAQKYTAKRIRRVVGDVHEEWRQQEESKR
jgi:hypothetical protein